VAVAAVALAVGGGLVLIHETAGPGQPAARDAPQTRAPTPVRHRPTPPSPTAARRSSGGLGSHPARLTELQARAARVPARLVVPALEVDAPVLAVGTDRTTGEMQVPPTVRTVAWWSYGARPGDPHGTTVLAAHVDYDGAYGLFFHLAQLSPGHRFTVVSADGSRRTYRIVSNRRVPKPALRGQNLFRTTGPARLALVTCGGGFDRARRSYLDNVIALAVPVAG
jgi:hypothetical protein